MFPAIVARCGRIMKRRRMRKKNHEHRARGIDTATSVALCDGIERHRHRSRSRPAVHTLTVMTIDAFVHVNPRMGNRDGAERPPWPHERYDQGREHRPCGRPRLIHFRMIMLLRNERNEPRGHSNAVTKSTSRPQPPRAHERTDECNGYYGTERIHGASVMRSREKMLGASS
jgi:hypothetical protein